MTSLSIYGVIFLFLTGEDSNTVDDNVLDEADGEFKDDDYVVYSSNDSK